jgi:transposase
MDDHRFDPKAAELHRIEVISGTGRRRRWPAEVKARIVAESFAPGVQASDVARRHGMRPQQLFGWRREMREGGLSQAGEEAAVFVPLVARLPGEASSSKSATGPDACVEIALRGVVVRVRGRIAAAALAEVLAAVKSVT